LNFKFEPYARGGLQIWKDPEENRKYVAASDTAGGLARGDFAVVVVIEGETCEVVARWKERDDPHVWGPKCAWLSWYYNEALLAFETYPSAHGYTACMEAINKGYKKIYKRQRQDTISKQVSEVLGWHTNSTTKPLLIDRIKRALDDNCHIPDEELLYELRDQRWNGKGEMESRGHDDMVIAYGIALAVRDQSWTRGLLRPDPVMPKTESERYWAAYDKRLTAKPKKKRLFHGY